MKKTQVLIALFISISLPLWGQETSKYWIFFSDKPGLGKMIQAPELLLSEKALARRERQNIPIDHFDVPVFSVYVEQLQGNGIIPLQKSRWLNAVSAQLTPTQKEKINQLDFVTEVRPVATLTLNKSHPMLSPFAIPESHLSQKTQNFDYGATSDQITIHNGEILHTFGFTGQGMTIAVCDGGFNGAGPSGVFAPLHQNGQIVFTQDFVGGGTNVYRAGSHGTRVLSTMAFNSEGLYVGTAPDANYILLRTEDESSETTQEEDNWVAAVELADSLGADLLNTSLGYTTFDNGIGDYTYEDMDGRTTIISQGAAMAARKGMLLCISAGNYGSSPWRYISAPADADSVLTIGAVSSQGATAPFSSEGPSADGRLKPNVVSVGVATAVISGPSGVQRNNGTSFSSPNLCGLVACLWQAFPEKNNMEIIGMVERSSHQFDNPDFKIGYGIPNFEIALLKDTATISVPDEGVAIFPNPFNSQLFIRHQLFPDVTLEWARLYGLRGEAISYWDNVVRTNNAFVLEMDPALAPGSYLLQLRFSDGQIRNHRIIKN